MKQDSIPAADVAHDVGDACSLRLRHGHWFPTSYPVASDLWGPHTRTAAVYASDEADAARIIAARGLGETLTGPGFLPRPGADYFHYIPASALLLDPTISEARKLHALCWLAFLSCSAGVADAATWFGDSGILHEWAHVCEGIIYKRGSEDAARVRGWVLHTVRAIERKTPGLDCREDAAQDAAQEPSK